MCGGAGREGISVAGESSQSCQSMAVRYDYGMKTKDWGLVKMVAVLAGVGFVILTSLTVLALFTLDFRAAPDVSIMKESEIIHAKAEAGDVREVTAKAEAGDARAQYFMGLLTMSGTGVPKDSAKAMDWIRKSAEQGFAYAQGYLADEYESGEILPKDMDEAIRWATRAANQGHPLGQLFLADYYHAEDPPNAVEAYKWYSLAAKSGYTYMSGVFGDLKKTMTMEQIAEGDRLVREFVAVKEYVEVKQ